MSQTDKRTTPRVAINAPATLQALGTQAMANGMATPVAVVDASERGMRLLSAAPLDAGQAVKIELNDAMFLGEVCYCAPVAGSHADGFHMGIMIQECLTGLTSLHHLIHALTPEPAEQREPVR